MRGWPSFSMTLIFTETFAHLRNRAVVRGALAGVMASFVGMLAVVIHQLTGLALTRPAALALAAAAYVAVRWFMVDIVWVFDSRLALRGAMLIAGVA